jgi:thiamine-phosphate pyrophosphorylase
VECALKGGATCIQLREKELSDADFLREALDIKKLCRKYHVPFVVNDNVKVAIECGADGVHVGQHDMQAKIVRAAVGESMILGVSAQTVEQAVLAENGADYLGVARFHIGPNRMPMRFRANAQSDLRGRIHSVVAIGGYAGQSFTAFRHGRGGIALISAIFE